MVETDEKVRSLAGEVAAQFEQRSRDNGDKFWVRKDEHRGEDWIQAMCMKAHDAGGMLPDDWRYGFIVEALDAIHERADVGDLDCPELEADIYTSELTAWLHSRNDRTSYVDDAIKEFGKGETLDNDLMAGQVMEKEEVYHSILASLRDHAEE